MSERPVSNQDTEVLEDIKEPSFYKVLLLNDDYTPMEFVIQVLKTYFQKTPEQAEATMWQVHNKGRGLAGVYSFEVAETKAHQVQQWAQKNNHPLQCELEEDE